MLVSRRVALGMPLRFGVLGAAGFLMVVSVLGLIINFAVLSLLLAVDVASVPAEAAAICVAAPATFLANRLWSFRPTRVEHVAA
jgi:putative flippase GtrA